MVPLNNRLTKLLVLVSVVGLTYVLWQTNGLLWLHPFYLSCSVDLMNRVPLNQDDPCVIRMIREKFLYPPSHGPVSLTQPEIANPSMGQAQVIMEYLNNKRNGFFIECGALDGETRSNTLFMEQHLDWNGVLIEGDPSNFQKIRTKNRKAWAVSSCLSLAPNPTIVTFHQQFNLGRIAQKDESEATNLPSGDDVEVQCFPIFSILLALNRTEVDYFSLDIEGDELSVLRTIPWHLVNIQTLSVEFIHDKEGKDEIKKYMEDQGYRVIAEVTHPQKLANDFIFVKNDIVTLS